MPNYLCFTFTRFFKPHLFQVCAPGYKNTFKNNDTSGACVYFQNENPSDISSFLIRIPLSDTYFFSWSMFGFSTTAGIVRLCFYLRYKILFLQKRSTNTELSFNLYDLTKEFNPGKKNNVDHCFNNSGFFLYIPGHLNWHTWQDFLWKRFFLNHHELSFFPVGDCTIALLQFISTITFLKNWGENPLHSIQRKIIIPKNIDNYWTQILIHVLLYH